MIESVQTLTNKAHLPRFLPQKVDKGKEREENTDFEQYLKRAMENLEGKDGKEESRI